METVTVVGLGYVGLPVACLCAIHGYNVYGVDTDKNKVSLIEKGICPIKDSYLENEFKKAKDKLQVTDNVGEAIKNADIIYSCCFIIFKTYFLDLRFLI